MPRFRLRMPDFVERNWRYLVEEFERITGVSVEEVDRLLFLELIAGISLFLIGFVGTLSMFGKFALAIKTHYGAANLIPVQDVRDIWNHVFSWQIRFIIMVYIGGLLTMHGAMGIFGEDVIYRLLNVVPSAIRSRVQEFRAPRLRAEIVRADGGVRIPIILLTDRAPRTCEKIWNSLPIEGTLDQLGPELYIEADLEIGPENQRLSISAGEIVYSPMARTIGIFTESGRALGPVNVFARVGRGGFSQLRRLRKGDRIVIVPAGRRITEPIVEAT